MARGKVQNAMDRGIGFNGYMSTEEPKHARFPAEGATV
jgi:hypothetical protein